MKTPALRLGNLLLALAAAAVTGCNSSSAVDAPAASAPTPIAIVTNPASPQLPPAAIAPAVAELPPVPEPRLEFTPSANLADLIKLARAGVSDVLMLKFIQYAPGAFGLGAQEIIYLNDLGVSENVINSMMERDRAYTNTRPPAPAPVAVAAPAAPAPATVIVEQQPTVVVQPAPVTVNYFYETLTPYGSWVEVEGYGRCWQPTVVIYQNDWRPYSDRGRWVYTDLGWYWASDYSWGNVVFHYGRWFNHPRRGWCWSPDTVWAPAWVSWRRNDDYCGWAPLPPAACYRPGAGFYYQDRSVSIGFEFGLSASCYTFVSRQHFTEYHPRRYAAPHTEITQIFNTTTVNNYYSGGGRNDRVVNHGIAPAVITAGTENQIRPVRAPEPAAPGVRPDRSQLTRSPRENIAAPAPVADTRPGRPQTDSLVGKSPATTTRPGVAAASDRPATPDRSSNDRSREINSPRDNSTRERETAYRRPNSDVTREPVRSAPEKNFTPVAPTKPAPVLTPSIAAPSITKPTITTPPVREREINRPNVVGPAVTRPAPFDRESRATYDPSHNTASRVPTPLPIAPAPTITRPAAPQVTPQPERTERPNPFSIPSRNYNAPEPRSQPEMQPRYVTPQPRPQPVAPSYTPAPQRPQFQPAPQPRMESPQPSFTPRSVPAMPAPAPSAPRMESRPTPSPAPAAPARSEGRSSGGDREKRDR